MLKGTWTILEFHRLNSERRDLPDERLEPIVAVIDTGVLPERLDPSRTVPGVNLSGEGIEQDTTDGNGHGTLVASTICNAAGVRVMPVKLLGDHGCLLADEQLEISFEWILERHAALHIAVVCASFADAGHLISDERYRPSRLQVLISVLRDAGVPTVAPAGNRYRLCRADNPQGMAWPAILREVVSVGALQREPAGLRLSHASQRLHADLGTACHTTLFAEPGPPGGTSGAAAVVAGRLAGLRAASPAARVDELVAQLLETGVYARDDSPLLWPALAMPEPEPRGSTWLTPPA